MSNVEQIGGTHYAGSYQHWDYCDDVDVPHLESAASKYIARWYLKGGIQDLQKAVSYIDKRLSTDYAASHDSLYAQSQGFEENLERYFHAAAIMLWEQAVSRLILCWKDYSDLEYAKNLILAQIKHEEKKRQESHE